MFKLDLEFSEEEFLIDLLEVNCVRIKNHIAHMNQDLRRLNSEIIDTERTISSNRLIVFHDPKTKLQKQLKERQEIEAIISNSFRQLRDLRSMYKKLVVEKREFLLDNPKVFGDPGPNAAFWHGYKSYHYDRVG